MKPQNPTVQTFGTPRAEIVDAMFTRMLEWEAENEAKQEIHLLPVICETSEANASRHLGYSGSIGFQSSRDAWKHWL